MIFGWDLTNKVWLPVEVDSNGLVKVDLSNINLNDLADVYVPSPSDLVIIYWNNTNSRWEARLLSSWTLAELGAKYINDLDDVAIVGLLDGDFIYWNEALNKWMRIAHKDATTGIHGVGTGTVGSVSTANKTIYVDKAATGAEDGTSWTDAFTTIQDAVDSLENVILHDYTIKVRKGSTPYRETVHLNSDPANHPSHLILGTLTIEAEHYWYGDCEANVGGAGEITDTGAFANVEIGDRVYVIDLTGASGQAQDYEVCTVDNIDNIPDRIGTDGTLTPTTNWKYVVVRTEISGSDDGTDGGTARDYCFRGININSVNIYGFKMTFSDSLVVYGADCRGWNVWYNIVEDCDYGMRFVAFSQAQVFYCYIEGEDWLCLGAESSLINAYYDALYGSTGANDAGLHASRLAFINCRYTYVNHCNIAVRNYDFSEVVFWHNYIKNDCSVGLEARGQSLIDQTNVSNNAITPESPAGTSDNVWIGH